MTISLINYQKRPGFGNSQGLLALCLAGFFRGGRNQPKGWSLEQQTDSNYIYQSNSCPLEIELTGSDAIALEGIVDEYGELLQYLDQFKNVPLSLLNVSQSESPNQKRLDMVAYKGPIPKKYVCPLSKQVLTNPVNNPRIGLPDVEQSWITIYIEKDGINPFDGKSLQKSDLQPNVKLQREISIYVVL